ncbi:MAG: hypothetical protein P8N60_13155 [Burkholderiaceae bacterium]|nr:hypothetical protein [Burkholderiaceae bacterium]
MLNFSKIHVPESVNFRVIGFHHPYCSIKGLADCFQGESPVDDNAFIGFGCYWMGRVGILLEFCGEESLSPKIVNRQRATMLSRIDNSEFWSNGGLLYLHILSPHPPGISNNESLDSAYSENVADAASIVLKLSERLNYKFPTGFQLFISTDHPLRPNVWCGTQRYVGKCDVRKSFISTSVPLISISNGVADICQIKTNADIFQCVGRKSGV